jgi:hypothetical protein
MTGAEATRERLRLGYTQGALAGLLNLSAPTVVRREAAAEVPAEYATALQGLPPAPATGRGPYQRASVPTAPAKPPPLRRRAQVSQQLKPRAQKEPHQAPAAPSTPLSPATAERVYEADELGAVLLEGADLRVYWARVSVSHILCLARIRQRRAQCR